MCPDSDGIFSSNPAATPESPMSEARPEQPEVREAARPEQPEAREAGATGKRPRAMFEQSAEGWRGAVFSLSNAGCKSNVSLHGEKFARGRNNVDLNSI
jgi:hypothetical protein